MTTMCKRKKYNPQTSGYKIDIFVNGEYRCSTDWQKTLKAAKERFSKNYNIPMVDITATFHYQ